MTFANPWGLLALAALPVIVLLHLFLRRFPPLMVAGLHLWGLDQQTSAAGRRRERLPLTRSLLLELLAALLAALVLSQPQVRNLTTVNHLVVVLDDSASMGAVLEGQETVRDRAIAVIQERIEELGADTVCTVLKTGVRPESLTGAPVRSADALELLESWQPTQPTHDFQSTWDVANQVAGADGHLLFVTNRMPDEELVMPARMQVEALGRPRDNLAIELARWQMTEDGQASEIHYRVRNLSSSPGRVRVIATGGDEQLFEQTLQVPGQSTRAGRQAVRRGAGQVKLRIESSADSLAIDNTVTLLEPRPRLVRYRIELPADRPEVAQLQRVLKHIPQLVEADDETPELVFGTARQLPDSRLGRWWLGLGPIDSSAEAMASSVDLAGPFLMDRLAPLLDGVVLGGVFWGGVQDLPWDLEPLVSSDQTILLGQVAGTLTQAFVMNLDLQRTNLTETPDWPILLSNLVESCRADQPGLRRWNFRLNEVITARIPQRDDVTEPLLLIAPNDQPRVVARDRMDRIELRGLSQPGVYRLREGDRTVDMFSVGFHDPVGSDLGRLGSGSRAPENQGAADYRVSGAYNWLILCGLVLILICLLADWYVLRQDAPRVSMPR